MAKIFDEFVVLRPDLLMDRLPLSEDLYARLASDYDAFKNHILISAHRFDESWPTWERHPQGDELVILLAGSTEFRLRSASGEVTLGLHEPGSFVVVPRNTWHTAVIPESASMLFITAGEGTQNEVDPADR